MHKVPPSIFIDGIVTKPPAKFHRDSYKTVGGFLAQSVPSVKVGGNLAQRTMQHCLCTVPLLG